MLLTKVAGKTCVLLKALELPKCNELRLFSRWTHRRPVRVLMPEEPDDDASTQKEVVAIETDQRESGNKDSATIQWRHAKESKNLVKSNISRTNVAKPNAQQGKQSTFDMLQAVIDGEGKFVYTKMKDNDPRISSLLTIVKSKKSKLKKNLILLEGKRLINDALQNGCKLQYLLFTRKDELEFLKHNLPKTGATLYKMPYREMQMWSDLTVCPGVMGIFEQPEIENFQPVTGSIPVTVICDNIREPGNLGSVLRTCAGAGCQKVILTKGCVNVWDTKVTRSGSGAHFHLQIQSKSDWPEIEKSLGENCKVFVADNNTPCITQVFAENAEPLDFESLPFIPYYSVRFSEYDSLAVILGGETDGLSAEAYKCALSFNGARLHVPLVNKVESLNSGVALGVIIFEIKRQLLLIQNIVQSDNR